MRSIQRIFSLLGIVLLAAGLAFVPACRSGLGKRPVDSSCTITRVQWTKTELYFGLSKPGGQVSETEWRDFVAREVTSRFPDGLTVLEAYGQWRNPAGRLLREKTKLIVIVHPDTPQADTSIQAIRENYRKTFHQESVLRVDGGVKASF